MEPNVIANGEQAFEIAIAAITFNCSGVNRDEKLDFCGELHFCVSLLRIKPNHIFDRFD